MKIKKSFTANDLKLIAIFAMALDHISLLFFNQYYFLTQLIRAIGRITIPIMCYFIAEGYKKTKNINRYTSRLILFSIVSHYAFYFFATGKIPIVFDPNTGFKIQLPTSVIFTLLLGLLGLRISNSIKIKRRTKLITLFIILSASILGDGGITAVLWILNFGRDDLSLKCKMKNFYKIASLLAIKPLFQLISGNYSSAFQQLYIVGVLIAPRLLNRYNGNLGSGKKSKWAFYLFYPLHLCILRIIKYVSIG